MSGEPRPRSEHRELRLAQLSDLDRIETVVSAAYENTPPPQVLPALATGVPAADAVAALRAFSKHEAGEIWVGGDPIVGAIILIEGNDTLLVENLAVDPSAQGTGLGRQLMEFAEQMARDHGLQRVALHHNDVNLEHRAFFDHLGYAETHRRTERGPLQMFMEKRVLAAV